jgi:glycine oxidase
VTAPDVVVIGGGVIGLAVAWRAAASGRAVVVCDPSPGQGASWVAAGMLAPVTEATAEEAALTRIGLASAALWPAFAADLATATGIDVGLRQEGTLQVAFDSDDRRALEEQYALHRQLGLESEWCSSRRCRTLEPLLSPNVRGGVFAPGDWQVDPRAVVTALIAALRFHEVPLRRLGVRRVRVGARGRATGVDLDDGTVLTAQTVVVCAGAHSAVAIGLSADVAPRVRPVKGEILRLQADPAEMPFTRIIRGSVEGRSVYLVPRSNGEVVIGATMQEAGFDTSVRAGAVHDLLHAAISLVPAIEELRMVETSAGLRPGTADNAPLLGPSTVDGLVFATGHHRNGVLLAPFTADVISRVLAGEDLPGEAGFLSARRFA